MKYRFSPSKRTESPQRIHCRYVCRGRNTLRKEQSASIPIDSLFGANALPAGKKKRRHPFAAIAKTCQQWGKRLRVRCKLAIRQMAGIKETTTRLWGTLCAALLVTVLSGTIMIAVLFGRYNRPSTSVPVPNFLEKNIETILTDDTDPFSFVVQYEYNQNFASGAVISQSPGPGVTRRLYGKDDRVTVTLTVCKEPSLYTLPALSGQSRRDAVLSLKKAGMTVKIFEEYSSAIPSGTVIRSEPQAGEHLAVGSEVTLTVSMGKEEIKIAVPDLLLLSENAARGLLETAGLAVGQVTYEASELPMGSVISQKTEAGSLVSEGSAVSFTVSLGQRAPMRSMPNLFGLSLAQAREKLREVGLTVGTVQTAPHASPSGTVIAQALPAGTPITSATTSVDLTVSE